MFRAGTSNIVLTERNKAAFPEAWRTRSRLSYYASLFNSLEVNSSFYKVPLPATVRKWATEVPEYFQFTFKLWKEITHARGLLFDSAALRNFMDTIDAIGDKKGCLLLQLPPGSTENDRPQLERLLEEIGDAHADAPGMIGWKIAVEFRHRSWYQPSIYSLLDRHRASLVLHDMPASRVDDPNTEAPFIYLRYHGPRGDYKGSYSDAFLQEQARRIGQWMAEGKDVYAYFNNTVDADAPRNLATLNELVSD